MARMLSLLVRAGIELRHSPPKGQIGVESHCNVLSMTAISKSARATGFTCPRLGHVSTPSSMIAAPGRVQRRG
jgi:hypothetical protein